MSPKNFTLRVFRTTFVIVGLLLFLAATPALAYFVPTIHAAASLAFGQPDLTSNGLATTQSGMYGPEAVAIDPGTHKVFVADSVNNRVLRFASIYNLANGAPAEAVLGQPGFTTRTAHTTQNGMNEPTSVFVDTYGRLWVAEAANARVLRFDSASSLASGANANGVLGQPNFTSSSAATTQSGMSFPSGVFCDASGRLWVADTQNSRVLRFDGAASKANGAPADAVLGQPGFTSKTGATTQSGMDWPLSVYLDASGRLWVADQYNFRVLRFDGAASKANGANADGVLGQPGFTSKAAAITQNGMSSPNGVTLDDSSGRLYVADPANDRVLIYDSAAGLANGANATSVLGQPNFTTKTPNTGGLSAASLWFPVGVFFDPQAKVVLAADFANNRVLMYGNPTHYFSTRSVAADDGWVRESTQGSHVGGAINATGTLRVGDDASNRQFRSILSFDTSGLPITATIRSVTVLIYKSGVVGADPFLSFGPLVADIQNGSFGMPALEASDFQVAAAKADFGHFTSLSKLLTPTYQVSLPPAYFFDVNLVGADTQIRLRFNTSSNNDNLANYDSFYAGDATSLATRPLLKVEYTVPITP